MVGVRSMANIVINEISQNYTYNIGASTFATVAFPITACWGDGFFDPVSTGIPVEDALDKAIWKEFPANQKGLEAFVATYRGAASCYRTCKDFSYQIATTLLTSGYNVLVCRVCNGATAQVTATSSSGKTLVIKAKYAGSFGNNIVVKIANAENHGINYHNVVVYVTDQAGVRSAVENFNFVFDQTIADKYDNYTFIDDVESNFIVFENTVDFISDADEVFTEDYRLEGGTDSKQYSDEVPTEGVEKWQANTEYSFGDTVFSNKQYRGAWVSNKEYSVNDIATSNGAFVKCRIANLSDEQLIISAWAVSTAEAWSDATTYSSGVIVSNTVDDVTKYYISKKADNTNHAVTDTEWWAEIPAWQANTKYAFNVNVVNDNTLYTSLVAFTSGESMEEDVIWTELTEEEVDELFTPFIYVNKESATSSADFKDDLASWGYGASTYITIHEILPLIEKRYGSFGTEGNQYYDAVLASCPSKSFGQVCNIAYMEWLYSTVCGTADSTKTVYSNGVYGMLRDKLSYAPDVIISPAWDDQNISAITGMEFDDYLSVTSPIHDVLMDTAYVSRCAVAFIDIPKTISRSKVYTDETTPTGKEGYAQLISQRYYDQSENSIYSTHSALFAPWGQYRYVGTSKQSMASPSFMTLIIMRSMILNQTLQYFWALPTNRSNNARIGKLDYTVNKKYLDMWQKLDGVGVNVITDIPGIGTTIWGNSTLYDVPPATYNALQNLSTRLLIDEIKDVAYRCGIAITYQYNNQEAYSKFYAGVTPTLDTMKNVGAIVDYYVTMSADINALDYVNANSVIGKIYVTVTGVINDITIDLIALPQNVDLGQFEG